jgi:peptidoglycan/LPS O-acetylase OafA/YrhL
VPREQHRLAELDSLRGLAALIVVLHHFKLLWSEEVMRGKSDLSRRAFEFLVYPFTCGHEAVILFFVLSGFVLSLPAIASRAQSYPVFILRRIFRIYVPFLAALGLAILGNIFFAGHFTRSEWFSEFWSGPVDWRSARSHVLFLGLYNTDQFDPPIWSLVHEMRISIFFPFLCLIALKLKPLKQLIMAAFISCGSIVAIQLLPLLHLEPMERFQDPYLDSGKYAALFIVGIYVARQRTVISEIFSSLSQRTRTCIGILSLVGYAYGSREFMSLAGRVTQKDLLNPADWITAMSAAGLIVCALNSQSWSQVLRWRPILELGKMSYSIYLLHFIVMLVVVHLLYGRIPLLVIFSICLLVVIPMSWAFNRLIEVPLIDLGRKLSAIYAQR